MHLYTPFILAGACLLWCVACEVWFRMGED